MALPSMPTPKTLHVWCLNREWSAAPLSPSASAARWGASGSDRSSSGSGMVERRPSNGTLEPSCSSSALLPGTVRTAVTRALSRVFSFGSWLKTFSQIMPVPLIGYRNWALGPHAGASLRRITLERMSSNLMVATRSPTQIEFISSAGCAHTFALYGAMKDSVSFSPKPACSHCRKSRGFGGGGCASFCARSLTIPITSASGSRQRLACTGYPTHTPRMRAGE
mmetsp:Transcript_26787/g.86472  ORF Transcript_26787/g.86472 Transcript_26787/m.86472 type:complete len:223 (-) Transcript_26787:1665-2333(-)